MNYPTIVNNIPKEKNNYSNLLEHYADVDNGLAEAQIAIGEASNLAQVCLTYTYNFKDKKYVDYVCILSVLAQVAIDSAKRKFDIDLTKEIKRIKTDMKINVNKYPEFWTIIRKGFDKDKINKELKCPMNYILNVKVQKFRDSSPTIPMSQFFVKYELDSDRRKSKKVEELIQKYFSEVYDYNISDDRDSNEEHLLLRSDFDQLVEDIRAVNISKNYLGLMSWLIDRAFRITPNMISNDSNIESRINTNKSTLIRILYEVNSESLLKCFSGNIHK